MYFFDIYFHLLFRIMPRKDMECHQWYNPRRNQVSLKTKKKQLKKAKEGKLRTAYFQYLFEKSFTKLFHSDSAALLYLNIFGACETAFEVLCPDLSSPVQGRHWSVEPVWWSPDSLGRGRSTGSPRRGWWKWACAAWRRSSWGMILSLSKVTLWGGIEKIKPDSWKCVAIRQEVMDINWNRRKSDWTEEKKIAIIVGYQSRVQGDYGITILALAWTLPCAACQFFTVCHCKFDFLVFNYCYF